MSTETIDGRTLKEMINAGAITLKNNKADVDSLNVFPVPDGDTGTNMSLTLTAAVRELSKIQENSTAAVAQALSKGSLMGARGNSGVILSQLFRGFAKGVGEQTVLTPEKFAMALQQGVKTAYKAVIKPVEGTMLTVSKAIANHAEASAEEADFIVLLEEILAAAEKALEKTPSQLPILAQAGVVDAGGKGLCYIYDGWLRCLKGEVFEELTGTVSESSVSVGLTSIATESIKFQYCTELMIKGKNLREEKVRDELVKMGDSLIVVGEDNLIKIHVHTNHPGQVLEICLKYGELSNLKIDNMKEQHNEILIREEEKSHFSKPVVSEKVNVVAVVSGEGIKKIMFSLGCTSIIEGGQTMNPSTEAILAEVEKQSADKVIILPNNKNIILAAEQTAKLSTKEVFVLPTKSIPQGISAMLYFNPSSEDVEGMLESMGEMSRQVTTGQVTTAVRESGFNGWDIKIGDYLGMLNGDLVAVGEDREEILLELLRKMTSEGGEIITVYAGEISQEEFNRVQSAVKENFPDIESEFYWGEQPVYTYIVSTE